MGRPKHEFTMKYPAVLRLSIFLVGVCVVCTSCLDMVRRPSAGSSGPSWIAPGNPPGTEGVQQDAPSDSVSRVSDEPPTASAQALSANLTSSPGQARILRATSAERGEDRRRDVRQVNEYSFWCVRNELWDEARLHLEKALEQDSLAASLHNNVGVVYENLGQRDKAEAAYERARLLLPEKRLYGANLMRLQRRKMRSLETAAADSSAIEESSGFANDMELMVDSLGLDSDPPRIR